MIYLAQAYSIYEYHGEWNKHPAYIQADQWFRYLTEKGFVVFSPILYTHPFHTQKPPMFNIDYVDLDLRIINAFKCCIIIFLDDCLTEIFGTWVVDFHKSIGAFREYIFAKQHNIPCYRLSELLPMLDNITKLTESEIYHFFNGVKQL